MNTKLSVLFLTVAILIGSTAVALAWQQCGEGGNPHGDRISRNWSSVPGTRTEIWVEVLSSIS